MVSLTPASLGELIVPSAALTAGIALGFSGDEAGGQAAVAEVLTVMAEDAGAPPFGVFWAVRDEAYVGLCSFKRGLSPDGVVEIAYYTFPDCERQGVAGGMVEGLILIAWQAGAAVVTAHTLPEESASVSVLKRAGFRWLGEVEDPEDGEVWAWERPL
jgi:ribosomal-protein-alanine N-acetyltransferase